MPTLLFGVWRRFTVTVLSLRTSAVSDRCKLTRSSLRWTFILRRMGGLSCADPNTFSRPEEAVVRSFHWEACVDFKAKVIRGHVDLDVLRVKPSADSVFLDSSSDLNVKEALCADSGQKLDVDRSVTHKLFGVCTRIRLPSGEKSKIRVVYETSPASTALQWMEPKQTAGKRKPYVYSYSEAIHARALLPCQDTPSVKTPFTAAIEVPSDLVVVMSATKIGEELVDSRDSKIFRFELTVPIPVYLVAFVAGDLVHSKIGPRSYVWTEKEYLEKAVKEFEDIERMLKIAEDLVGPYIWKKYDLLVLPPAYPFGGMENPCLTFITPTILAGDKSLTCVLMHEISHSWTGNLVTNKNFEHFWLNEGFTMYLERKLIGRMLGEEYRQLSSINGLNSLKYAVETMGSGNVLTKLVVDLKEVHPDDSFSSIPYEKGFTLLYYLETLLGVSEMEKFLKAYVDRFKYRSIDTDDWKNFLYEFFNDKVEMLDKVDWESWLYGTGMPPVIPEYNTSLIEPCRALCKKWVEASEDQVKSFDTADFDSLNGQQKQEFFQLLLNEKDSLSISKVDHLSSLYDMLKIENAEVRFLWMRLGILLRYEKIIDPVVKFLESVGRMKFVGPLFRDLGEWPEKRQFAVNLYERLKPYMVYVTRHNVAKNLKLELNE